MRRFIFFFFILSTSGLNAQVFMRPFDNAAAMGMGGATLAYPGLGNAFSNESQLGFGARWGVWAGSALPYGVDGWQTAQFQATKGLGKFSGVGLSIDHSSTEYYTEQRFRLGYGRRLSEAFFLGGSADILRASAQEYGNTSLVSFSLGVLARALPDVWLGAKIQNPFQQKIGEDLAPTVLRVGASWKPTDIFLFSAEMEKDLDRKVMLKTGIEYRPIPILAVRAGLRGSDIARLGFGAGLRLKNNLAIDLGTEWHPSLGLTPSAMISWTRS